MIRYAEQGIGHIMLTSSYNFFTSTFNMHQCALVRNNPQNNPHLYQKLSYQFLLYSKRSVSSYTFY